MNYIAIDNSDIQDFKISKSAISDGKIIGTCELGKAEIQLLNDSNNYSNYKNHWLKTSFGSFFIYNVEPVQEKVNIKLSCYDIKYKLDVEYKKENFENLFPCSILAWRNAIAEKCGVKFIDTVFPNSDFILPSHPYIAEGLSARSVLMLIAEACSSFIDNDNNDNLYFSWFSNVDAIDIDDWSSLTTEKDSTLPINQVVLGRGDVEDNVLYPFEVENPKILKINNNYILDPQDTSTSNDRRDEMIEPIYNQVNGFKYVVFDMKTQGIETPIKLGNKISYTDIWGNKLESYVMSISLDYLGDDLDNISNWEVEISAEELKETDSRYSYSTGIKQKISDLSIKVDKENEKIQAIASKVDNQDSKIAKIELTTDEILSKVQRDLTLKKDITGFNNITVEDAKLGNVLSFNIYGNVKSDNEYTNLVIEDKVGNKRCIELPFKKLNYLDKNTYDEFVVENNNAKIIRRTEYSTVYNAIEIGDDLSGTRLKLNLYDFQQGSFDLLVTDNYRIRVRSWLNSDGSRSETTILENTDQTDSVVLYEYNSSSGEKIKIPYYKLPSDFGIVTEIWDYDIDHTLSNYITKETIGPLVKLDKEKIEDLNECFITLNNGYNKIYIESNNINYKMSYVIQNDYTDVLATQIDLSTTRSQTEKSIIDKVYGKYADAQGNIHEISSELENKIDKDDDGSLISMINASANVINLNSNRFSMTSDNSKISQDGSVEFLSGLIGGWHIDKNKLWCNIVPEYDYSESDYNRLREILNGSSYSNEEFQKYDIDKSGGLDSKDLLMCRQLIYFNLQKSNPGKLLLDTTDWVKPIKIVNSSGEVIAWFGIRGVGTKDIG